MENLQSENFWFLVKTQKNTELMDRPNGLIDRAMGTSDILWHAQFFPFLHHCASFSFGGNNEEDSNPHCHLATVMNVCGPAVGWTAMSWNSLGPNVALHSKVYLNIFGTNSFTWAWHYSTVVSAASKISMLKYTPIMCLRIGIKCIVVGYKSQQTTESLHPIPGCKNIL